MPTDCAATPMRPPSRLPSAILQALAFLAQQLVGQDRILSNTTWQ